MQQNAGLFSQHVSVHGGSDPTRVTSTVQHTQLTALRYTTQTAYRFGHQKAVLTNVLPKMGIHVESINQHFVASNWCLSYIISTMHGHTNFIFEIYFVCELNA
jgi:hypothetical protein